MIQLRHDETGIIYRADPAVSSGELEPSSDKRSRLAHLSSSMHNES